MEKDLLCVLDLTREEILDLFELTFRLKERWKTKGTENLFPGRTLGMLFDKPSTRTRVSFHAAMVQLGGSCVYLTSQDTQLCRNETVEDTARVLSRYVDVLAVRTYDQKVLEALAKAATVPVINALTDRYHPCQGLSDVFTILEKRGTLDGLKAAWVGDGNNVAHSWIHAAARLGFELNLACPEGYDPDPMIMDYAVKANPGIRLVRDPVEAVEGCEVISTDVWVSMGQDEEKEARMARMRPYQVNPSLVSRAADSAMVLHCLPAHRGQEITADYLDKPDSVIWDQAENKMHLHKALLVRLLGGQLD